MSTVSSIPNQTPTCSDLVIDSVKKICKDSDQVVVYGCKSCQYTQVADILKRHSEHPFKRVFSWHMGDAALPDKDEHFTAQGRDLQQIQYQSSEMFPLGISRPCKTTLVDVVLENYKRIEEHLPVIPVLFCIDIDGKQKPITMENIVSKDMRCYTNITFKELRRAYKLCTHKNPKIRKAAEETFRFVKMCYQGKNTYALYQIAAPWADAKKSAELMKARKERTSASEKENDWRSQLDDRIAEYERQRIVMPPTIFSIPALLSKIYTITLEATEQAALKATSSDSDLPSPTAENF